MKYKLGIITPIYITKQRLDVSMSCLHSLVQCEIPFPIKHVFVDDGSCGEGLELIVQYREAMRNTEMDVHLMQNEKRKGKYYLSHNWKDALCYSQDCEYIMSIPDDVLVNPWMFQVIEQCLDYMQNFDFLTFFKDTRKKCFGQQGYGMSIVRGFEEAPFCDGFMLLGSLEKFNTIILKQDVKHCAEIGSTGLWRSANEIIQAKQWKILCTKESLAQHIGNSFSSMTGEPRKLDRYIRADNVNLWDVPQILKEGE